MPNPSLDLRGGASGPSFEGSTPGYVLTVDADGKTVSPQPGGGSSGGLTSFNGRTTPAAVPTAGDYSADQVTNTSTVAGLDVEEALDTLQDEIDAVGAEAATALGTANAASAAAATAQTTANTAVTNAATAQGTANAASAAAATADGKAVAAQTTANTAVTDAATAQGTANAASAAAATADGKAVAAQTTANTAVTNAATADAKAVAAEQPFVGEYYVNSAFAGTQLGSASNPFTTIAAAFAFAVSVGVADGIVRLNRNHTENVVFPTTGSWELAGLRQTGVVNGADISLTGTVDLSCTTSNSRRALTNLVVVGAISGNASAAGARLRVWNVLTSSTMTLTGTGAGYWRASFAGIYQIGDISLSGALSGLLTITGIVTGANYSFAGGITVAAQPTAGVNSFSNCIFVGAITAGVTGLTFRFLGTTLMNAGQSFVSTGTTALEFDGNSWTTIGAQSPVFTGTFTWKVLNGNKAERRTIANNLGSTLLTGLVPTGQMTLVATLTLLTAGTLGTAVVNAIYTDLTGVVRTKPLGAGLSIAGAAGDEFAESLTFCVLAGTAVSYSVTGIVTPGALSLSVAANLRSEY